MIIIMILGVKFYSVGKRSELNGIVSVTTL